ncbi:sigma-70 family RNA polymerase sigma factor [Bdellovibrionota bacterium FG-1]
MNCETNEGFSEAYRRFKNPLLDYVIGRVRDRESAEELVQDIFMKAFRFSHRYDSKYAVSTWLWTIAKYTVIDHLRGKPGEHEPISPEELPSPLRNAEDLLQKKDEKKGLLKMIRTLPRMQKKVLWMRMVHQLSDQEIARKLGLSAAAVKNLAYRAKNRLFELGSCGPLPAGLQRES